MINSLKPNGCSLSSNPRLVSACCSRPPASHCIPDTEDPLSGFPSTSSPLCSLGMSTPPKDLFRILFQTLLSLSWWAAPSWGSKDAYSLKTTHDIISTPASLPMETSGHHLTVHIFKVKRAIFSAPHSESLISVSGTSTCQPFIYHQVLPPIRSISTMHLTSLGLISIASFFSLSFFPSISFVPLIH